MGKSNIDIINADAIKCDPEKSVFKEDSNYIDLCNLVRIKFARELIFSIISDDELLKFEDNIINYDELREIIKKLLDWEFKLKCRVEKDKREKRTKNK